MFSDHVIFSGEGQYNLNILQTIEATNSFLGLDQDVRNCQNVESFDNCTTTNYLDTIKTKCKCLPLSINSLGQVRKVLPQKSQHNFKMVQKNFSIPYTYNLVLNRHCSTVGLVLIFFFSFFSIRFLFARHLKRLNAAQDISVLMRWNVKSNSYFFNNLFINHL